MIDTHEVKILLRHIKKSATTVYEYSVNDCMTFPMEWHDLRFGSDKTSALRKKYHNKLGAIKFYRNFLAPDSWCAANGYTQETDVQDGDFVIADTNGWPLVMIYYRSNVYWLDEDRLYKVPFDLITPNSIWRR